MKKLLLLSIIVILSACDNRSKSSAVTEPEMSTRCLNGVQYYLFQELEGSGYKGYGYMAPKYNQEGTLELCYGGHNEYGD